MTDKYYNTTHRKGNELAAYRLSVKSQEDAILDMFDIDDEFTPSEVWDALPPEMGAVPLTSVRRAITNLEQAGELEKTGRYRRGKYGRPEGIWRLMLPF